MIIEADDTSGTWNGDYYYDFLFPTEKSHIDPVDLVLKIKELIDNKPVTCARINLSNTLNKHEISKLTPELVYFCGAWPDPNGRGYTDIVNPNYTHGLHKHSDIMTRCNHCNNTFVQPTQSKHYNSNISTHMECPVYERQYTNAEINRKRASVLRTLLRLHFDAKEVVPRFGIKRDSIETRWAERMGVDLSKEHKHGERLRDNTMAHLIFRHSTKKLARVFDISYNHVSKRVKENTGVCPTKAYRKRRWG